jgi:hypothetical protein
MIFDPVATYALSNPKGVAVVDLESGRSWTYAPLGLCPIPSRFQARQS